MKLNRLISMSVLMLSVAASGQNRNMDGPFKVTVGECDGGRVKVTPAIPADGAEFPKGTVLKIKAIPDKGKAFECGYEAMNGQFTFFTEYFTDEFEVTVTGPCSVGASFVEPEFLQGHRTIQDVVYAKPGVKPLKYDVYIPEGAERLPGIIIIHGGGWRMNCEDVMSGMAREFTRNGRYVAFSIDYRWNGTADGDVVPNTLNQLIEDCYGAILHIQEHASEYGLDPARLAVTGDSAGGHLCSSVANMIERVGDRGFGMTSGVYEYMPTYMPAGMTVAQARENLKAIKAVAPNYGVFSSQGLGRFIRELPEDAHAALAPLDNIPDASVRKVPHWINRGTEDPLISEESTMEYFNALKAAGQEVHYIRVPEAVHAYYDWKPDSATKNAFWQYGAPYTRQMEKFFDTIFYL